MSSAYIAIRWRYSLGICLSIALWNAVCCIWLAGLQPMVSLLHAKTPSWVWNASIFLDSSSNGIAQKACIASTLKKNRLLCSFLISSVAKGSVLATGFRQWFISASIVTRYAVGGALLGVPGSSFGTMTKREKHRGSSHFSTTGVVRTKCSNTLRVAGFPW